MRVVAAIARPLRDEHVIAVDPPLLPSLDNVWRRRINPFAGRSLTDRALTAEQDAVAGMQRLRGQAVTAGVVSGLDVLLEPDAREAAPAEAMIQILPGLGLARSGEDVTVSTPRRIALGQLPVHARVDILDAIAAGAAAGALDDATTDDRRLLPRRHGPRLADLVAAPAAADLPRIAVLVAEPVTATIEARRREDCPPDPRDDPYDDLRRIDGARLLLSFWPTELVGDATTPGYDLPGPGADRRNRLAYRVFEAERRLENDETHPWEDIGVPLALVGFNADWTLDFIDRASVVRLGGRPRPRTALVELCGTPLLWQARVSQFVEHLAELETLTAPALSTAFRQLPPVGFLPVDIMDLTTRRQAFFPASFALSAAPIPLEHLDLAIGESAALAPINLDAPDALELLVPVPERVYEPGLLETAAVDPEFARAMARYVADRTDWLVRREAVRRRRDLVRDALTGVRTAYPRSELPLAEELPYPQDRAPVGATQVRRVAAGGGLHSLQMLDAGSTLQFGQGDRAFVWLRVVDPQGLTGLSLRFGQNTSASDSVFPFGVFWGASSQMPLGAGDGAVDLRKAGELPDAGSWVRLEVSADARWTASGAALVGTAIDGLDLAQVGGTIEWGPVGKVSADDDETIWIADDGPPGAMLRASSNPRVAGWPQVPAGPTEPPVESDFATGEAGGVRTAIGLQRFRARWTHSFLAGDFADLDEAGINGFIGAVESRLKVTNDAIDLGFVRARADIYRVRQYMLGGDAASRLVTSPALADIANRQEGARATSADLSKFVESAYLSDFERKPDAPVTKQSKPAAAKAPPVVDTVLGSDLFFNGLAISEFAGFTSRVSEPEVNPVARRAASITARPAIVMQPRAFTAPVVETTALAREAVVRAGAAATSFTREAAAIRDASSIPAFFAEVVDRPRIDFSIVQGQSPLPGAIERTVSVAERLPIAPAVEAHDFAIAGKYAVINALAKLIGDTTQGERPRGIALADLPAPGFAYIKTTEPEAPRKKNSIGDVLWDRKVNSDGRQYRDLDEKLTSARHEADYFSAAVGTLDNTVALMRLVEGRIDLYQTLLADAREVRDALNEQVRLAGARLREIGVELEEARHDHGVATALLAEEQDRVDALNARRTRILADHVKAIVYRRPREIDRLQTIPIAATTAALAEPPVAACLRDHDAVPEELREYAGLFRDAAVAWFPGVRARLDLIDRLEAARGALVAMRLRAAAPFQLTVARTAAAPKMLAAVHKVIAAQRTVHETRRLAALQVDVVGAAGAGLLAARQALAERASLADLIAGDHHRAALARLAATEVEGLAQVAGCLHASFGETPPVIRLQWAEMLSEFDQPAPLAQLSGLPRWNTLPLELRRRQQGFVDWLFARIDRRIDPAEAAINELVRIALLLAAHAPVERMIPARLIAPAPARIGSLLHLTVDVAVARVGMAALIRGGDGATVAHAVIDDIAEGVARARIVKTFAAVATIAQTMSVHLSDTKVR